MHINHCSESILSFFLSYRLLCADFLLTMDNSVWSLSVCWCLQSVWLRSNRLRYMNDCRLQNHNPRVHSVHVLPLRKTTLRIGSWGAFSSINDKVTSLSTSGSFVSRDKYRAVASKTLQSARELLDFVVICRSIVIDYVLVMWRLST